MMSRLSHASRQRIKLIALIALFAGPVLAAWVMVEWRVGIPEERVAHGRLMPALPPLSEWPLERPRPEVESGDWVLAYDCSGECTSTADRWWRLHRALGREAPRVTRLRLGANTPSLPGEVVGQWRSPPEWNGQHALWIIDPEGRVVLAYGTDQKADVVLEDIQRLLRMNPQAELASRE